MNILRSKINGIALSNEYNRYSNNPIKQDKNNNIPKAIRSFLVTDEKELNKSLMSISYEKLYQTNIFLDTVKNQNPRDRSEDRGIVSNVQQFFPTI